ncbi:hypothetical protein E2C01_091635 [Portunus trituberculatus]|uniref:Uncharacterized protein n=1 Tax=Portunus trituberculatus TaxID=210409 RepID=A0A5B7JPW5_PORTR|nr:hypothetical protein [Portunus trituberculatus]
MTRHNANTSQDDSCKKLAEVVHSLDTDIKALRRHSSRLVYYVTGHYIIKQNVTQLLDHERDIYFRTALSCSGNPHGTSSNAKVTATDNLPQHSLLATDSVKESLRQNVGE